MPYYARSNGKSFMKFYSEEVAAAVDYETTIQTLDGLAAFTDGDSRHLNRVGQISALIAESLDFTELRVQQIKQASRWHDIGKIAVYAIISLERRLTSRERMQMQKHTKNGADIIRIAFKKYPSPVLELSYLIALHHHQTYCGTGYPSMSSRSLDPKIYFGKSNGTRRGRPLKGEEIPIEALITSIADCFDALMDPLRPYRHKGYGFKKAVRLIHKDDRSGLSADQRFGPDVAAAFFKNLRQIARLYPPSMR